jgi:hypothetical protein
MKPVTESKIFIPSPKLPVQLTPLSDAHKLERILCESGA